MTGILHLLGADERDVSRRCRQTQNSLARLASTTCAPCLARAGWAASLTRDGLARTDILAVKVASEDRRMIEVQVKTITTGNWPLGAKGTLGALSAREWYVLVRLGQFPDRPRTWVVPRDHVAAATWIGHMSWLTNSDAKPGTRNAGIASARLSYEDFARYEDRWDLLDGSAFEAPVLLAPWMRGAIDNPKVGLPERHSWRDQLPEFVPLGPVGQVFLAERFRRIANWANVGRGDHLCGAVFGLVLSHDLGKVRRSGVKASRDPQAGPARELGDGALEPRQALGFREVVHSRDPTLKAGSDESVRPRA